MNRFLRWSVTAVLALDAAAALAFLSSEVTQAQASPAPAAAATAPAATAPAAPAVAPAAEPPAAPPPVEAAAVAAAPEPAAPSEAETIPGAGPDEPAAPVLAPRDPAPQTDAFRRLLRAYENMEPESAARALAELATRDRRAVVELILGSKARTSGAILDALTRTHPGLAADLSYEIWRRGQEPGA